VELRGEQGKKCLGDAANIQAVVEHADAGLSVFGRLRPALFVAWTIAQRAR
jgi:hypothetical protein